MGRLSYILKVADPTTNKVFICNRNSDNFIKVFSDKYVEWFEYAGLSYCWPLHQISALCG